MSVIELWGGVEPTVNRVGDSFHNQLQQSGRGLSDEDFERIASLGIRTLRQPLLWELVAQEPSGALEFEPFDRAFARLRELGIAPIAGLLHHGSGPRQTSLIDPGFAAKFARYARACAERYPWVTAYTPINEPLTTARFSTLYGLWYPHLRDDAAFARAVVNQCRATVLAMREIRKVNPAAQLIQTDDAGTVLSTDAMGRSARFENERRWLTFDLIGGKVTPHHRFWRWLQRGVEQAELEFFLEDPCSIDVMGLNYYVTSDRFLDERLERYPPQYHGGNAERRYADIEAVRAQAGLVGHQAMLMAAWQRYATPIAITEVHLDCTREEQLRWLRDAWAGAHAAASAGVDVRAVTAWSLFGAYDWNSLLTRKGAYYEAGAFDLRAPSPRPTAVAKMIRSLATAEPYAPPALDGEGWWVSRRPPKSAARHLCIVGEPGVLRSALMQACEQRDLSFEVVARASDAGRGWAVLATDASAVVQGPWPGVPMVVFSNHGVFDGKKAAPYVESDEAERLRPFEARALEEKASLIIRTSTLIDHHDERGIIARMATALSRGEPVEAASEVLFAPSAARDVARVALDLLIDEAWGVWHLINGSPLTWRALAEQLASTLNADPELIRPALGAKQGITLASEKGWQMPSLTPVIERFAEAAIAAAQTRRNRAS